jgi:hypothetical protein
MPEWLLILLGVVAGLLVVGSVIRFSFISEVRRRKRKSWLAKPSGNPHEQEWEARGRLSLRTDPVDGD